MQHPPISLQPALPPSLPEPRNTLLVSALKPFIGLTGNLVGRRLTIWMLQFIRMCDFIPWVQVVLLHSGCWVEQLHTSCSIPSKPWLECVSTRVTFKVGNPVINSTGKVCTFLLPIIFAWCWVQIWKQGSEFSYHVTARFSFGATCFTIAFLSSTTVQHFSYKYKNFSCWFQSLLLAQSNTLFFLQS
jgi:hypothetical protein